MNSPEHDEIRMLSLDDMTELFRVSKSTIKRRIADGALPPPIMLGGKSLWHKNTLEAWIIAQHGGETVVRRKREIDELC